jgi:hypothetical protein
LALSQKKLKKKFCILFLKKQLHLLKKKPASKKQGLIADQAECQQSTLLISGQCQYLMNLKSQILNLKMELLGYGRLVC